MKAFHRSLCAVSVALGLVSYVHAGVTINGTRVIYDAGQREASLSMINDGKEARLMQAWIDAGDATQRPETSTAPFLITPPMARINPGQGQTMRILFTGAELPQDRETVFWVNIMEIPPKPQSDAQGDKNYLQMAVRSRLKLFYRPRGLMGTVDQAPDKLTWRVVQEGGHYVAECNNPSAYNVSFSDVRFKNTESVKSISKGGMCPAKGTAKFPVAGDPDVSGKLTVMVINDYGGFNEHDANFTR